VDVPCSHAGSGDGALTSTGSVLTAAATSSGLVLGCRGSERASEGTADDGSDGFRDVSGAEAGKVLCCRTSIIKSSFGGTGCGERPSSCLHRLAGRMEPFFAAYSPHALQSGS
jgi:hypothetical protein